MWSDGHIFTSADYDARVVLNGNKNQQIHLEGDNRFNELEIINSNQRIITWSGDLTYNTLIGNTVITADNLRLDRFDLNGNTLTINGSVLFDYDETVCLNGGTLTIKGDLLQKSGTIDCYNGTLNVSGDYVMETTSRNNVGDLIYDSCYANLEMNDEYDKVNIGGNLIMHNIQNTSNYWARGIHLETGVITIGGNVWSDGHIFTSADYGARVVLNGNKKQSITLNESDKFNILVLTKTKSNYTFSNDECWNELKFVEIGSGDVNGDGIVSVSDVILLQKWLLAVPNTHLPCWQAADMCTDNKLNVFDLCVLKQKLISLIP